MIHSTSNAWNSKSIQSWASRMDWGKMPKSPADSERRAGLAENVKFDPTLVAVYEKARLKWAPGMIDIRIYNKPQQNGTEKPDKADKPGKPDKPDKADKPQRSPVQEARKDYRTWLESLTEESSSFLDSIGKAIDASDSILDEDDRNRFKSQLEQWLVDQRDRLEEELEDAPNGIAKKLLRRADLRLGELKDQLWERIGEAVDVHTEKTLSAQHTYSEWDKSLSLSGDQWLQQLNDTLQQDADGTIGDRDLAEMSDSLTRWIADRQTELAAGLEEAPTGIRESLLDLSDDKLTALRETMWKSALSAVEAYKQAAEQSKRQYGEWDDSLPALSSPLLDSINRSIFDDADDITDAEKNGFQTQLDDWVNQERARIGELLDNSPAGLRQTLLDDANERLDAITTTMNRFIQDSLNFRAAGDAKARQFYESWNGGLQQRTDEYLQSVKDRIMQDPDTITDSEKTEYERHLLSWIDGLKSGFSAGLSGELNDSLTGVRRKYASLANEAADGRYDSLWTAIQDAIRQWNGRANPGNGNGNGNGDGNGNGNGRLPSVLDPKRNYGFEYGHGDSRIAISLKKTGSGQSGRGALYVADRLGNKREVVFKFGSKELEKQFEDLLRENHLYGRTLSIEKFDKLIDKLKRAVKDVSDIDLDRLKSAVYGEDEKKKLNTAFTQMLDLFKQMIL